MRIMGWIVLGVVSLGLAGCTFCCTVHECCTVRGGNALNQLGIDVPDAVAAGVLKALPGFQASELEIETEDGKTIYEFEGTADGKTWEVEVDAEGNVLEIEEETGDDGDED